MKKCIAFFLCSLLLYSCGPSAEEQQRIKAEEQRQSYIQAINSVLAADAEASKANKGHDAACASQMRTIDLTLCPADFATAYVDHIHAWEYAGKIQKAKELLQDQEDEAVALGVLATLLGLEASPFSDHLAAEQEVARRASEAQSEISRTWKIVEHVAVSYGATLPK